MALVEPDKSMIVVAFVFLILSSVCQVLVPKFTGAVLDSLVDHMNKGNTTSFTVEDDGYNGHGSLVRIPGFARNIELLVSVALVGGVFGGLRGSIFTVRLLLLRL
jgi:ABC-type multidrug transport system fused ATPase/permease subunit